MKKGNNMSYHKLHFQLAFLFLALSSAYGEISSEEQSLLDVVRATRAVTLPSVQSGRGVGVLETVDEDVKGQKTQSKNVIKFCFIKEASLRKEYSYQDTGRLYKSVLEKNHRNTDFFSGNKDYPAQVHIQKSLVTVPVTFFTDLRTWTYQEIGRMPCDFEDENVFFNIIPTSPFVKVNVEKRENMIRLIVRSIPPKDDPTNLRERIYDFDMANGAMLASYVQKARTAQGGNEIEDSEEWKLSWEEKSNLFLPRERKVTVLRNIDGKFNQRRVYSIQFTEFRSDKVDPRELDISNMEIPPGTPVYDQDLDLQWAYSEGTILRFPRQKNGTETSQPKIDPSQKKLLNRESEMSDNILASTEKKGISTEGRAPSRSYIQIFTPIIIVVLVIIIVICTSRMVSKRRQYQNGD